MSRSVVQIVVSGVGLSPPSPSTTAIGDSAPFARRPMNAFGTPNLVWSLDLCGWGRGFATRYAYGLGSVATGSAGGAMADIARSGCLIFWGYNPSMSRLTHATATVDALKRGMKLIVIDRRNVGLANKTDIWLRVRPGTDGALALGLANVMIDRGSFDQDFIRDWSHGPLLVRSDTGRLLRESGLRSSGDETALLRGTSAWANQPSTIPLPGPMTAAARIWHSAVNTKAILSTERWIAGLSSQVSGAQATHSSPPSSRTPQLNASNALRFNSYSTASTFF